jgi:hypothetical protein
LLATVQDDTKKEGIRLQAAMKLIEAQQIIIKQQGVSVLSLKQKLAAAQQELAQARQTSSAISMINLERFEASFVDYGGYKGVLDLVAMHNQLAAPGQVLAAAFYNITEKLEGLQSEWFRACFEHHATTGNYPLRDLSNVVFRVHMVELEDVGDTKYRKNGDYRVGETLIEADGCTSLKEVCKRVCAKNLEIRDYRNFLAALNSNLWSAFQQNVQWKMWDCKDGEWGNEFIWSGFYYGELRSRHESVKDIWVGIVRGYNNQTVRLLEHGRVEAEEL